MNIFFLDFDQEKAARYYFDKHVVKMILETAQILCTAMRLNGVEYGYKSTHAKHPCITWAASNSTRFYWLKQLGLQLCREYFYRYDKIHKCEQVIKNSYFPIFDACWVDPPLEPLPQCMPEKYKNKDPIKAYRNYYLNEKLHLLSYRKNRKIPEWMEKENKQDEY